jgi:hypothetical protein
MLVEPRHDHDEIAGAIAAVELVHQNFVPDLAVGAGRAGSAAGGGLG